MECQGAERGRRKRHMNSPTRVELIGSPFDPMGMQEVIDRCLGWCEGPRASHTVVTMNAALLCMLRRDAEFRAACHAGDIIVADGVPVVWTSRLAGRPLPERVAGADLMPRLLEEGAKRGLGAYFLGARREVVDKLVAQCRTAYPGLVIAGWRDGYFGPEAHDAIAAEIARCKPHLLFVGMPSPFKEIWAQRYRDVLDVPVILNVGGTFDVMTGYVRRAPRRLQAMGMEWAWRLAMEPRRMWKRYLVTNTEFIGLAVRDVVRLRLGR